MECSEVFNNEACWLASVGGTEADEKQMAGAGEKLAAKRCCNDRLPIFLFGSERMTEMGLASRAQARQRLRLQVRAMPPYHDVCLLRGQSRGAQAWPKPGSRNWKDCTPRCSMQAPASREALRPRPNN